LLGNGLASFLVRTFTIAGVVTPTLTFLLLMIAIRCQWRLNFRRAFDIRYTSATVSISTTTGTTTTTTASSSAWTAITSYSVAETIGSSVPSRLFAVEVSTSGAIAES
jgi:hypothetical protein